MMTVEQVIVIHGEDGSHDISLPCCGQMVHVPRRSAVPVCRSCHRELADPEQIAELDPPVCVFCYTH